MSFAYPWTALVTVAALAFYVFAMTRVGNARRTYNVAAPAIAGNPDFERIFRVQANTLEQMVFFLPVLWLFAAIWGDGWAALIGIVWPVGRVIYALGYYQAAEKRAVGFAITALSSIVLLIGVVIGVLVRGF
jgi:uncharacterized membrane protein YecN with MAPEG domain